MHSLRWRTTMRIGCAAALTVVLAAASESPAIDPPTNAKGKISRNFYRFPYADGTQAKMSQDYVDHGNTPAGNTGPMDFTGLELGPFVLVAAADGEVFAVRESLSDCGCHSNYGPCANYVKILHANGEYSAYLHVAQNSPSDYGISEGVFVSAGDPIAIEGDVGWTCGRGKEPTSGPCVGSVPPDAGACGPHLHWEIRRESTNEFLNPMTCNIPNNIYVDDEPYTGQPCEPSESCTASRTLARFTYSGFGTFHVFQTFESITASTVTVQDYASVVFHAEERVRLLPGFRAGAGNAYFRAEIGPCNTTAQSTPEIAAP